MKSGRWLYAGAVVVALVVGLGFWNPIHVKAGQDGVPKFRVDPFWPKPLPVTMSATGVAQHWGTGEIAASCVDSQDNVFTYNRGWELGATVSGVLQNNESGAIVTQDEYPPAIPAPPIVAYSREGKVVYAFGNPALHPGPGPYGAYTGTTGIGRSAYMPHGAHGCFVDYNGYVYVGGNGDGIVQKYNPVAAQIAGASATYVLQIGTKDVCDTATGVCGEPGLNVSHTLLDEPPDIAVDPEVGPVSGHTGDIYIADGYGNHRVVVFNPALATASNPSGYVGQWGESCGHNETPNGTTTPGTPCPFNTFGATGGGHPHCVVLGNDGNVYLCDRPNSRILVIGKTSTWIQPSTGSPLVAPPPAAPVRVIYVGGGEGVSYFPSTATPGNVAAILSAGMRACDINFYPTIEHLASESPWHQKYILDTDLGSDQTWFIDKATGMTLSGFGRCGLAPCPGHNVGEFAYAHTVTSDSHGDVYVAETITGRRLQKFVRVDDDH